VDIKTHEAIVEEGKVKTGWNIVQEVQDYVGILRCFKCCGYYHFAKDCKKDNLRKVCRKLCNKKV